VKVFASPADMPRAADSNSGSMRPSPSAKMKFSALPPSKGTPPMVPWKSMVSLSPSCAGRLTPTNLVRCLRRTSSVFATAASSTVTFGCSIVAPETSPGLTSGYTSKVALNSSTSPGTPSAGFSSFLSIFG
jgi:hypothetical protein